MTDKSIAEEMARAGDNPSLLRGHGAAQTEGHILHALRGEL